MRRALLLSCVLAFSCHDPAPKLTVLSAPAGSLYTVVNRIGKTVIPNGRFITPLGKSIEVAPHPYGLILNDEEGVAVTANSGIEPLSISIIRRLRFCEGRLCR